MRTRNYSILCDLTGEQLARVAKEDSVHDEEGEAGADATDGGERHAKAGAKSPAAAADKSSKTPSIRDTSASPTPSYKGQHIASAAERNSQEGTAGNVDGKASRASNKSANDKQGSKVSLKSESKVSMTGQADNVTN